ncbi:MAG: bidirectional hydrogenase complex protein HoxE [Acidimicrobiia bacterium]
MTDVTSTNTRPGAAGRSASEPHPSGDDRFLVIDKHLKRAKYDQDQLIETLHIAQDVFGYLDEGVLAYVARSLRLPPSMVFGVATFYQLFTFEPAGDHTCTVCTGTACFVKGADDIVKAVGDAFDVASGDTTEDGSLTLKTARCVGSCGLAPIVLIDGEVNGREGADLILEKVRAAVAAEPTPVSVGSEGSDA